MKHLYTLAVVAASIFMVSCSTMHSAATTTGNTPCSMKDCAECCEKHKCSTEKNCHHGKCGVHHKGKKSSCCDHECSSSH